MQMAQHSSLPFLGTHVSLVGSCNKRKFIKYVNKREEGHFVCACERQITTMIETAVIILIGNLSNLSNQHHLYI